MIIRADGVYEKFDLGAAVEYLWDEGDEQVNFPEIFWRKFQPTTGQLDNHAQLLKWMRDDYILIRMPTQLARVSEWPLLRQGLGGSEEPVYTNLVIADAYASMSDPTGKRSPPTVFLKSQGQRLGHMATLWE